MVLVRTGTAATTVELIGTSEASYEAEFAAQTNVDVNTNHAGFEGTGFVDGFAEAGDSVSFEVYAPQAGSNTLVPCMLQGRASPRPSFRKRRIGTHGASCL